MREAKRRKLQLIPCVKQVPVDVYTIVVSRRKVANQVHARAQRAATEVEEGVMRLQALLQQECELLTAHSLEIVRSDRFAVVGILYFSTVVWRAEVG